VVDVARAPVVISPFAHPGAWGMDAASIRAYREADAVLATIEADAEVYRGAGVEDVRVVGLPVPAVAAPGPRDDPPLVLFLGARRNTKGVDLLLDSAQIVWRSAPDVRFAFVGPGPELGRRDERLLDVGAVDEEQRGRWLGRARVLCLPSESESFGLVVAEAWTARTPAVVSDIPVLRDLVTRDGGGLAAERTPQAMAGALLTLVGDEAAARRMGDAGHAHWEREYRPEAVARRHLAVYDEVLSRASISSSRSGPRLRSS
jgi:glycosyltransferase involved in cell wall biosynthesis